MNEPKKAFWSSIPGVLTGTATVITAILGLFGALNRSDQPSSAPTPSPSISYANPSPSAGTTASPEVLVDDLPEVEVVPTSIDFGQQRISSTSSRAVTVSNPGAADLEMSSVEVEGDGASAFVATPRSCTESPIAPGGSCEITVSFTPSSGDLSATLALEHNAQSTPTRIPLSGKGVLLQL